MLFTMQPLFEKYDYLIECNEQSGGGSACFGTAAVLRMSFVLFLFHTLIIITLLPRLMCSSAIHDGFWCLKFLLVIGAYIGVFWIPNTFYYGWAYFARVAAGLYLILQVALLLITAFTLNEKLVKGYEESGSLISVVALVGLTSIFTFGTLAFIVMQFIWFKGCGGTIAIVVVTLVAIVIFFVLNLLKTRNDASIFTASFISSYIAYLGWSAMSSIPDEQCNALIVN